MVQSAKPIRVARPAGKGLIVVRFLFDANEIAVGYSDLEYLKVAMVEMQRAQNKLIKELERAESLPASLAINFEKVRKNIEDRVKGRAAENREGL